METEPKKTRTKGGRPRVHASAEKRPVMAFRIRGGMHEKLIASAKAREVSLSEEIEFRLEQSFKEGAEPYIDTALRMAAANCMVVQELTGQTIASDRYTRSACAQAAATAIELVGGLAGRDAPEARALLQTDAEGFGQLVGMFTKALYDGAPKDATDGLGQIIEAIAERRRLEIAEKDLRNRTALARALREEIAAKAATSPGDDE
jgi:hypothetical protein